MIIVVTGSRDWVNHLKVWADLDALRTIYPGLLVGVGDCPTGVDKYVRDWCELRGVGYQVFEAKWHLFDRAAGPLRNRVMVDTMRPVQVYAYLRPESRGTRDCANYARSLDIPVIECWERP